MEFSEVRRMGPRGRCREAHGMTARALIYTIDSPVYTPHLRPFSRILPSSFISFRLGRRAARFQQIFRFGYCSLAAGIWHATYVYIGLGDDAPLFLILEPGAARTRLVFGGVWPGL